VVSIFSALQAVASYRQIQRDMALLPFRGVAFGHDKLIQVVRYINFLNTLIFPQVFSIQGNLMQA
jgi:hypothetical protein